MATKQEILRAYGYAMAMEELAKKHEVDIAKYSRRFNRWVVANPGAIPPLYTPPARPTYAGQPAGARVVRLGEEKVEKFQNAVVDDMRRIPDGGAAEGVLDGAWAGAKDFARVQFDDPVYIPEHCGHATAAINHVCKFIRSIANDPQN